MTVHVVAGILVEGTRVLLAQRSRHQSFPLLWEFPGGKVEAGETNEAALVREYREELGIGIEPLDVHSTIEYQGSEERRVRVVFYRVRRTEGEPAPLEVESVGWFTASELPGLDIIPANRDVMRQLKSELERGENP